MTENKTLPFDMEHVLKIIKITPTLRECYKQMLSKPLSHTSSIADIIISAKSIGRPWFL